MEIGPARSERSPWLAAGAVLALALGLRLALALALPTLPVSDFRALVDFGLHLAAGGPIATGWYWIYANPALPLALATLFSLGLGEPETVARLASAVASAMAAPLPMLLWRGYLPSWAGLGIGLALALWPGQVLFSGVVAQENWALAPTVALAALAMRVQRRGAPAPIAAGLLWAAAGSFRQELWLALVPLGLAAAGFVGGRAGERRQRALALVLALGVPAALLAGQRYLATGRLSLGTEHGGLSLLGTVIPGATAGLWRDPLAWVSAQRPELVLDRPGLRRAAWSLAWKEIARRPVFQAGRAVTLLVHCLLEGEADMTYWSLTAPGAQPPASSARAAALAARARPGLRAWSVVVLAAGLAALLCGVLLRSRALGVLGLSIALKLAVHVVFAVQGRLLLPVTALALVAVAVAAVEARERAGRRLLPLASKAILGGAAFALGLFLIGPRAFAAVIAADRNDDQPTYRFPLVPPRRTAGLLCEMREGRLDFLATDGRAALALRSDSPEVGERAVAICAVRREKGEGQLELRARDPTGVASGPRALSLLISIDGQEAARLDLAAGASDLAVSIPAGAVTVGLELILVEKPPAAPWLWSLAVPIQVVTEGTP